MSRPLDPHAFRVSRELAGELGLVGLPRAKALKVVRDLVFPRIRGLFRGDHWHPVEDVFSALRNAGIDFHIMEAAYVEADPPGLRGKRWVVRFPWSARNGRSMDLQAVLWAHAAGSAQDPMDRYDLTFSVG